MKFQSLNDMELGLCTGRTIPGIWMMSQLYFKNGDQEISVKLPGSFKYEDVTEHLVCSMITNDLQTFILTGQPKMHYGITSLNASYKASTSMPCYKVQVNIQCAFTEIYIVKSWF